LEVFTAVSDDAANEGFSLVSVEKPVSKCLKSRLESLFIKVVVEAY
jgi:hypothetical protein